MPMAFQYPRFKTDNSLPTPVAASISESQETRHLGGDLETRQMKEFEDAKLVCVDVKATDTAKRVFIVEVQIVLSSSFAKRAVYYAAKAYFDQLTPGLGYGKLKSTYAVCLLMRVSSKRAGTMVLLDQALS